MGTLAGTPYRRTESKPRSQEVRRGAAANPPGIVDAGALATERGFQRTGTDGAGNLVEGGPRHLREQLEARRQERLERMLADWADDPRPRL